MMSSLSWATCNGMFYLFSLLDHPHKVINLPCSTRALDVFELKPAAASSKVPAAPLLNSRVYVPCGRVHFAVDCQSLLLTIVAFFPLGHRHEYLTSIPAVNAFHPFQPVIASGTASGKIYTWLSRK